MCKKNKLAELSNWCGVLRQLAASTLGHFAIHSHLKVQDTTGQSDDRSITGKTLHVGTIRTGRV